MKILITGGAGFIGSHIADLLIENDFDVCIVDNLSMGRPENINNKARFYNCDLRHRNLFKILGSEKPDVVIHNAAQISVSDSVRDPLNDLDNNITGSVNLFEVCSVLGIKKIIFASSGGEVYGEQKYLPIDESHPLKPINPYGIAKLCIEKYLYFYYLTYGIKYIALRYANVYGPRQVRNGESGVIAIFIDELLKGWQPIINGDGKQTRDYVFVKDVAQANLLAVSSNYVGPLNIGTSIETDVNSIFNMLNVLSQSETEPLYGPARKAERRRGALSFDKAYKILGWQPKVDLKQGIKLTWGQ